MSKWMDQGGTALPGLKGISRAHLVIFVSVTVVSCVVNLITALWGTNQSIFSRACPPQGFEVGWRETINRCRELERDHWP